MKTADNTICANAVEGEVSATSVEDVLRSDQLVIHYSKS